MSWSSVRRIAGWDADAFKKASRTLIKSASSCCGRWISRSRPMQVRTKKRHSIYKIIKGIKGTFLQQLMLTSDNDRTGGLTQSSQLFASNVRRIKAGEMPSHCVLNCNWRRFNWQNISVRKAMKAVKRGLDGFFTLALEPKTLSLSWYHWRQVLSNASKKVSFCSFAMIEMHRREIGRAYLKLIN